MCSLFTEISVSPRSAIFCFAMSTRSGKIIITTMHTIVEIIIMRVHTSLFAHYLYVAFISRAGIHDNLSSHINDILG